MSVTHENVDSYEEFCTFVTNISANSPTYFYFSGSKLPSGISWCSDCVEAEPIVNAYLAQLKENITFVHVNVGDREYWKNPSCPFRTDPRLKLMVIPTLLRWKGVQRLEGSQCNNRDLLEMLFTDDDD